MHFSFLGLGNLGTPLAENILRAGEELCIYTRRPEQAAHFAELGAKIAPNIAALANCDVLCTCLPMPADVVEASGTLYPRMRAGAIHLDFSTIEPDTAKMLAKTACGYSLGYVQATVSKSPAVAREGKSPFFVGGASDPVERVLPVLEKIGVPRNVGSLEAACGLKLLSNLVGMANVAVLAEGMRLGKLAGIDGRALIDILLDTGAASYQMKMRGPMIAAGDFTAQFAVDLAAKDLRLGCAMAENLGYEPKMMRQALHYLQQATLDGLGGEDVCALFKIMGTNI